ncbi:hypothetical protein B0H34DRAFT_99440 [Crassisporium funariophilum]|nr:hypothetical protein B0H34DRAFT_99440 [Crassisporium funariophilum]
MSILDLPNELLNEIAKYTTITPPYDLSLPRLSLTCQHLYYTYRPLILQNQDRKISDLMKDYFVSLSDEEGIAHSNKYDQQPPTMREAYLHLTYRVADLNRGFYCVHSLILRSKRLRTVVLNFGEFTWQTVVLRVQRLKRITALVNSCIEKPGVNLTILCEPDKLDDLGGPYEFQFSYPAVVTQPSKAVTRGSFANFLKIFRRLLPRTSPVTTLPISNTELLVTAVDKAPKYPVPLPQHPQITGLRIHSLTFFLSSFLPLTIHTLNTAPITTLRLDKAALNIYTWSRILAQLTMPHLTELAIGKLAIAFPDLEAFSQRHPLIVHLDTSRNIPIGVVRVPPQSISWLSSWTTFFPDLTTLIGNAQYISSLLEHPTSFPALQEVGLRFTSDRRLSAEFYPADRCDSVFDLLAHRPSPKISLTLESLQGCGLVPWLLNRFANTTSLALLPCVQQLYLENGFDLSDDVLAQFKAWRKLHGDNPLYTETEEENHNDIEQFILFACDNVEKIHCRPQQN